MSLFRTIVRQKNIVLRKLKLQLLLFWCKWFKNKNDENYNWESSKKILLLRLDDKIGDMVVATGTIKKLSDAGHKVFVLSGPTCENLLSDMQYITKYYLYQSRVSLNVLKKECFDVVIDFDDVITYERCRLIHKLGAKNAIGFNKNGFSMYDTSIDFLDAKKHITERHKQVLRLLEIDCEEYRYFLKPTQTSIDQVDAVLTGLCYDYLIALNPFTGSEDKDLSYAQVVDIADFINSLNINAQVLIIGQEIKVSPLNIAECIYIPGSTVNTAIEIVKRADLIISPDTSVVHMACAFDKRLIAIYNQRKLKDTKLPGHIIWSPNYDNAVQFVTEEKNVSDVQIEQITQLIGEQIAMMIEASMAQKRTSY